MPPATVWMMLPSKPPKHETAVGMKSVMPGFSKISTSTVPLAVQPLGAVPTTTNCPALDSATGVSTGSRCVDAKPPGPAQLKMVAPAPPAESWSGPPAQAGLLAVGATVGEDLTVISKSAIRVQPPL